MLIWVLNINKTCIFNNPSQPGAVCLYPTGNIKKNFGFLMFSGGIDKQHRVVMG